MSEVTPERWQDKRSNLKEAIQETYKNKDFADVTFTVGSKVFKAHKLILSARCTEFGRLLFDPNAVTDIIIEDKCITEIGFEILLRFIYTDTLGTNDKLSIVQAYAAANHYKQKKLKEKCEELMQAWTFTIDEICELLNASLEIANLKEQCLNYIKRNARGVVSSENFFKLNYAAMISILDNDALKDVGLKERIIKVIEWARKKQDNPDDMTAVRKYCLESSPPLLGKLKIEELRLDELSEIFSVKYLNLLEATEIMNFMQYTHTKNADSLPYWCKKQ